jgi:hypothetical protein
MLYRWLRGQAPIQRPVLGERLPSLTWDEPSAACGAISKTSAWPSLVARLGVHSMWNTQNLVMLCSSLAAIDLVTHPAARGLLTESG